MSLTERQAKLMELMTTRHQDTTLLLLKCLREILEAPEPERTGMVEAFLYGYPIPFDQDRPGNDDELDVTESDSNDASLSLRVLMESGNIRSLQAMYEKQPTRTVAIALTHDLKALSPYGQLAQLTLLVQIVNTKLLPYLGDQEIPRISKVSTQPIRQALLANPRLFAIYVRTFQGLKAPSWQVAAMIDHVLVEECQTSEQRHAFLMTILEKANSKRGSSVMEEVIEEVRSKLDTPVNPKVAN